MSSSVSSTFCKIFLLFIAWTAGGRSLLFAQEKFSGSLSQWKKTQFYQGIPSFSADTVKVISPYDHSPKKATILSAVLPGAGQYYNKKYWKIPIIYAAAGTSIFFITYNNRIYKSYRDAYSYRIDSDTNTKDLEYPNLTDETVRSERERFLRYRDISILCLVGVYALQIIDANVDAHLFAFDVSDDLGMHWQPYFMAVGNRMNSGISLSFTYKLH